MARRGPPGNLGFWHMGFSRKLGSLGERAEAKRPTLSEHQAQQLPYLSLVTLSLHTLGHFLRSCRETGSVDKRMGRRLIVIWATPARPRKELRVYEPSREQAY